MVGGKREGAGDIDLDGSARAGAAPQIVMKKSTDNAVENNGDDDGAVQQQGSRRRPAKRLWRQFLLQMLTALEETAHRSRSAFSLSRLFRGCIKRPRHHRDVCNSRLLHRVHYIGKRAKWHTYIGAKIDHLFAGGAA